MIRNNNKLSFEGGKEMVGMYHTSRKINHLELRMEETGKYDINNITIHISNVHVVIWILSLLN